MRPRRDGGRRARVLRGPPARLPPAVRPHRAAARRRLVLRRVHDARVRRDATTRASGSRCTTTSSAARSARAATAATASSTSRASASTRLPEGDWLCSTCRPDRRGVQRAERARALAQTREDPASFLRVSAVRAAALREFPCSRASRARVVVVAMCDHWARRSAALVATACRVARAGRARPEAAWARLFRRGAHGRAASGHRPWRRGAVAGVRQVKFKITIPESQRRTWNCPRPDRLEGVPTWRSCKSKSPVEIGSDAGNVDFVVQLGALRHGHTLGVRGPFPHESASMS